jgi:hypothetical protein
MAATREAPGLQAELGLMLLEAWRDHASWMDKEGVEEVRHHHPLSLAGGDASPLSLSLSLSLSLQSHVYVCHKPPLKRQIVNF